MLDSNFTGIKREGTSISILQVFFTSTNFEVHQNILSYFSSPSIDVIHINCDYIADVLLHMQYAYSDFYLIRIRNRSGRWTTKTVNEIWFTHPCKLNNSAIFFGSIVADLIKWKQNNGNRSSRSSKSGLDQTYNSYLCYRVYTHAEDIYS